MTHRRGSCTCTGKAFVSRYLIVGSLLRGGGKRARIVLPSYSLSEMQQSHDLGIARRRLADGGLGIVVTLQSLTQKFTQPSRFTPSGLRLIATGV